MDPATFPPTAPARIAASESRELVSALRDGDEVALMRLVERSHQLMVRLAMNYVPSRAVAEEVAQDAWLSILRQLASFEGRSSLRTWMLRILSNMAKTRGVREHRTVPLSALARQEPHDLRPMMEPECFVALERRWASSAPGAAQGAPEDRLMWQETRSQIEQAIERLPPAQRTVITLRAVRGWTSQEVCEGLGLTRENQRVLLHRARSSVRRALQQYLDEPGES